MLTRYWFKFKNVPNYSVLNIGVGITAYDINDAKLILDNYIFPEFGSYSIDSWQENVDISKLDENHVRPNMGNPVERGVWFPKT